VDPLFFVTQQTFTPAFAHEVDRGEKAGSYIACGSSVTLELLSQIDIAMMQSLVLPAVCAQAVVHSSQFLRCNFRKQHYLSVSEIDI
jgi:hypothetical protein